MKSLTKYLLNIVSILFLSFVMSSCSNNENEEIEKVKEILPGEWVVKQYNLSAPGTGYFFNGAEFFNDTILQKFSTIEIPNLENHSGEYNPYVVYSTCTYLSGIESADIAITNLFSNKQGVIVSFRVNGYILGSTLGNFLKTANMWSRNCIVEVVSDNLVNLVDSNDKSKNLIILERR